MEGEIGRLRVEPLGPAHDRAGFSCGVENLDRYLKQQASQDVRRKANAVFVLVEIEAPVVVVGYFTCVRPVWRKATCRTRPAGSSPRYPLVSATLLGRLAVASERHVRGVRRLVARQSAPQGA